MPGTQAKCIIEIFFFVQTNTIVQTFTLVWVPGTSNTSEVVLDVLCNRIVTQL